MLRNKTTHATPMVFVAAIALSLLALSSVASATSITWKGVTFETQGSGTATIDSNGYLLLTPTSSSFALHVNRLPNGGNAPSPINANGTPFVSFSYIDPGVIGQKIDFSIQDETVAGEPRIQAGSLFDASQLVSATYGDNSADRDANEQDLFFTTPRQAASHDLVIGKTADNTLYAGFDGAQRSSDIFKNAGINFDFNDVLLRVRNGANSTFTFTNLTFGDNFSPSSAQDVPEPGSLAMFGLGLGGLLLLLFGFNRRRSRD
ncbi:MAG: PEP-CTERM sorting domain-containing protein [Rhodanobacter sp.]